MKMRIKGMFLASLAAGLIFSWQPSAFSGTPTTDEVLKRLDDLSTIIQQQQKEIERLKQELNNQKKAIETGQEVQKEEIKKVVKAETKEAEKSWRDKLPGMDQSNHAGGRFPASFRGHMGQGPIAEERDHQTGGGSRKGSVSISILR